MVISKRKKIWGIGIVTILVVYFFCLPQTLFTDSYSTVLESNNGELLSATIAKDGQWRFPETDSVPSKFAETIITYEDKRFWYHPGVDVLSFGRAIRQNISAGKIVSGGSTLSMQVIRLSRRGESRTVLEKCIELILATRLELRYTKAEILALYASHAPFGGNVVGIDAACWRYFGRNAKDLSWGEAALLAVLPNSPALIHPGRNRDQLKAKRDGLLDKLKETGKIDEFTCSLAKAEPIPEEPVTLPRLARHLLTRMRSDGFDEKKIKSTIDMSLQQRVEQILEDHHQRWLSNQIHNGAVILADVQTGNVLAYAGNVTNEKRYQGDDVDVITAPRSTGSILKPFLYAAMLDEGKILPKTLLPDIPTFISGFSPKNFSKDYDGAVPADKALMRSLNIPAVHLLRDYRYEKFHPLLKELGMSTLDQVPDHYGLSLILGGAEGTLWDITGMYASLSRTLNNYFEHPGKNKYDLNDFHSLHYISDQHSASPPVLSESGLLSAAAIYQTFDALKELYRPGEGSGWKLFSSTKRIAWKTGTSFGFRDGWAVGVTPQYVIGVWVGNANGEGRPGLTGTEAAAPVLFDVLSLLPEDSWFVQPEMEMEQITTCAHTGFRNGPSCTDMDTTWIVKAGLQSQSCPYHKKIHLSPDHKFRVHSACQPIDQISQVDWFVLPPVQEYYFQKRNISYRSLPPFRKDCQSSSPIVAMDMVYPRPHARIFIPRDLDGQPGSAIFELAHRIPDASVFWHLDGDFIGITRKNHRFALNPPEGKHKLTLVDDQGESVELQFEVLSKM
ncbi:MAG TPA: penicillin-binding protein 1C [Ohtaekwangia sp.]